MQRWVMVVRELIGIKLDGPETSIYVDIYSYGMSSAAP